MYRLRLVDLLGECTHFEGQLGGWVREYDPEAHDGLGRVVTTADPGKALVFDTPMEALHFAHQVPQNRPWRPDGRPNRPLTAFTIHFDAVNEGGSAVVAGER